jgi:hypothetical protein
MCNRRMDKLSACSYSTNTTPQSKRTIAWVKLADVVINERNSMIKTSYSMFKLFYAFH